MLLVDGNPSDLLVNSVLEQCAANDDAMVAKRNHKSVTVVIRIPKTVLGHHMPEQGGAQHGKRRGGRVSTRLHTVAHRNPSCPLHLESPSII